MNRLPSFNFSFNFRGTFLFSVFAAFAALLTGCGLNTGGSPIYATQDSDNSQDSETTAELDAGSEDSDDDTCKEGDWDACECDGEMTGVALCDSGQFGACECTTTDSDFDRICASCHGDSDSPAPPLNLEGSSSTAEMTVGAHRAHLGTSDWHKKLACSECHVVPDAIESAGHIDNLPADLTWGTIASADSASPQFDRSTGKCDSIYCHGSTLSAGTNVSPTWTNLDAGEADCGTCHGLPPENGHPTSADCGACHNEVYDGTDFVDASLHIDGEVNVSGSETSCTNCHGTEGVNAAPPVDVNGNSDTSLRSVGAHQSHLRSADWRKIFECNDCHVVPSDPGDGHNNGVPLLTWDSDATQDGASPNFNGTTCSGVYCHGATLDAGGATTTPTWTGVGTGQAECNDCHGNPPGGSHPASSACGDCHSEVYNGSTFVAAAKHIDGIVQQSDYHDLANWESPLNGANHHGSRYFNGNQQRDEHNTACTNCHGANLDGGTSGISCNSCHSNWRACTYCHGQPPPEGADGETSISSLSVGKHAKHNGKGYACTVCHTVPATGNVSHTTGHVQSTNLQTAEHHGDVAFTGTPAGGTTWNVNATVGSPTVTQRGSCLLGCHSNGNGGNPATTPYWAGPAWTTTCDKCHAATPASGEHDKHVNGEAMTCTECHPDSATASHLNGVQNVLNPIHSTITVTPNVCNGNTQPRCTGTCHNQSHDDCW